MSIVKNRSEIIFLYDVKDANPNGDPLDENKPRIDEETGINIVTDVRLKRTIRDYLHDFKEQEIFVREVRDGDGYIQDAKMRAKDFLFDEKGTKDFSDKSFSEQREVISQNILKKNIDVRLFGATIPLDLKVKEKNNVKDVTGSLTFTGPVQFKIGRSLHRVFTKHFRGTGAFADSYSEKKKSRQRTFREEDFLPYSLICFYGIINENAAKTTKLTDEDVQLLLDGIWNGTKNLISRSKAGQIPRLLIKVNYSENNYHIGDLNNMIKPSTDIPDEEIRDITQMKLNILELMEALGANVDKISNVEFVVDDRVTFVCNGEEKTLSECLESAKITANQLKF